ncbi:MAG TPA: amidophosphoribosyltransferase [Planctomycetaceae bacterium]|nr:amidophosphoribosyltransferase [Planctomycetaceae bacterium]HRE98913.1 amidophosphoribosyltransferase [Pirellulaceae bacterium]
MSELFHECGVAAIYHLDSAEPSPLCPEQGPDEVTRLLPRMLLDIQNRGQLAAGISTYQPQREQLLSTYKELGTVSEVFRLSHRGKAEALMRETAGRAGIGHVRYATCGCDDRNYAQPFERHHLQRHKWFSFGFNGQLANYGKLKAELLAQGDYHLSRDSDTEIIMHEISRELSGNENPGWLEVLRRISRRFDGAYSLALINAAGEMVVARDPLGIKPMCWAKEGALFAAASESVALLNLGFDEKQIRSLEPGHAILIGPDGFRIERFADEGERRAHCFFEWIYFANVASTLDDRSVYLSRTRLGAELAEAERKDGIVTIDQDTIVVPVPDTSKAAADSMAYELGVPSREGLIRNRYSGRTFIEGGSGRRKKAETKYTPLREVLQGKRVILVEDSIVRSTTMKVLIDRIYERGGAKEIHVRVACPPIVAPCFYGIDMSTIDELFAPRFMDGNELTTAIQDRMASELGCDSLRYLPVEAIARSVGFPPADLCQACITGEYPTPYGQHLYQIAKGNIGGRGGNRTYEAVG